jgi:hypothetical protein
MKTEQDNFIPSTDCKYQVRLIENGYSYYKCMTQVEFDTWKAETKGDDVYTFVFMIILVASLILGFTYIIKN